MMREYIIVLVSTLLVNGATVIGTELSATHDFVIDTTAPAEVVLATNSEIQESYDIYVEGNESAIHDVYDF